MRQYWSTRINRWALRRALKRKAPNSIPRTGPRTKGLDCFVVQIGDANKDWPFLADGIHPNGITGFWWEDDSYSASVDIPNASLAHSQLKISHYVEGYEFEYFSALAFLFRESMLLPYLVILSDKVRQRSFNSHALIRKERIQVLQMIVDATMRDRHFAISSVGLMSLLYSNRWVFHPKKDETIAYCSFILSSLKATGDLTEDQISFRLAPKALATIAEFETDERKHRDQVSQQRALKWFTLALVIVGAVQAWAAWTRS